MQAAWSDMADRPQHSMGEPSPTDGDDLPFDHHLEELLATFNGLAHEADRRGEASAADVLLAD